MWFSVHVRGIFFKNKWKERKKKRTLNNCFKQTITIVLRYSTRALYGVYFFNTELPWNISIWLGRRTDRSAMSSSVKDPDVSNTNKKIAEEKHGECAHVRSVVSVERVSVRFWSLLSMVHNVSDMERDHVNAFQKKKRAALIHPPPPLHDQYFHHQSSSVAALGSTPWSLVRYQSGLHASSSFAQLRSAAVSSKFKFKKQTNMGTHSSTHQSSYQSSSIPFSTAMKYYGDKSNNEKPSTWVGCVCQCTWSSSSVVPYFSDFFSSQAWCPFLSLLLSFDPSFLHPHPHTHTHRPKWGESSSSLDHHQLVIERCLALGWVLFAIEMGGLGACAPRLHRSQLNNHCFTNIYMYTQTNETAHPH